MATNPVFILFAHMIGTPVCPPAIGWSDRGSVDDCADGAL
jgi:hypothetical protein